MNQFLENYPYVDSAIGSVSNRNQIVRFVDIYLIGQSLHDREAYCSAYSYGEEFKAHVATTGSVMGFHGPHYAPFFYLDIDNEHVEISHADALSILELFENRLRLDRFAFDIFFSGNKGFHFIVPSSVFGAEPSESIHFYFERMASKIKEAVPHASLDLRIYDPVRLFRLPNTLNTKRNLFKVQITPDELRKKDTDEILALAKEPRDLDYGGEFQQCPSLRQLYLAAVEETNSRSANLTRTKSTPIIGKPPPFRKLCIYQMLSGVGQGIRDDTALRLADHFRKEGLAEDVVLSMLTAWNYRNDPPLPISDIERVVRQSFHNSYDFGCHDDIFVKFCQKDACYLWRKVEQADILTTEDLALRYVSLFKSGGAIKLGIPQLDAAIRGMGPGMVMEYMAPTGSGKTSFLLHVLKNISGSQGKNVLFLTLEMPANEIFSRLWTMDQARMPAVLESKTAEMFDSKRPNDEIARTLVKDIESFKHVLTVDKDHVGLQDIEQLALSCREKYGSLDFIAIDYLGRMQSGRKSPYEEVSALAKGFKSIAKKVGIPLLYLHQISRVGSRAAAEGEEIEIFHGRNSGETEEAADFVLTSWFDKQTGAFTLKILKNRKGVSDVAISLAFQPETMQFIPMRV